MTQTQTNQTTARIPYVGTWANLDAARRALDAAVADSNAGRINLCSPAAEIDYLPPFTALTLRQVTTAGADLYKIAGGSGEGIPKVFLDRLLAARGVSVVESLRVDNGAVPYVWRWRVTLEFRDLSGEVRRVQATKEVDLSDGSPDASQARGGLGQARTHGPSMAESKALNRAARTGLGIKGSIHREMFARPWVVAVITPHVDPSALPAEALSRIAVGMVLGPSAALYGAAAAPAAQPPQTTPPPQAAPPVEDVSDDGEVSPQRATREQLSALSRACDALGEEEFWRLGEAALGGTMPDAEAMTEPQAAAVLTACRRAAADRKAKATQEAPF